MSYVCKGTTLFPYFVERQELFRRKQLGARHFSPYLCIKIK